MYSFAIPIVSLLIALTLSLIITRVATMALMLTGLSRESARFQARSAFTGVGFTTTESESMVNHPVRRHIVMMLMLLGNVGIATVIAAVMITLLQAQRASGNVEWLRGLGLLIAGLFLLWVAATSRWVERHLNRVIASALKRFTHLDVRDYVSLLKLASGFAVSELLIKSDDWLADKSLVELSLAREGVLVLGIRRATGKYLGAPSGESRICAGDTLVIYGPLQRLKELDTRCSGQAGDEAHETAAQEYAEYLEEVQHHEDSAASLTE